MLDGTAARQANTAATFLPQDPNSPGTLPCVEIAGVQVYVYFANGELVISAHYDTADAATTRDDTDKTVPTRVNIGGTDVFAG
jgi:hypothetical protein